jgi:hypothetical protein
MCVEIYLTGSVEEIGSIGQLKSLISPHPIIWYPGHRDDSRNEEYCLCGIDLDATMEQAGYRIYWPDHRMHCKAELIAEKK